MAKDTGGNSNNTLTVVVITSRGSHEFEFIKTTKVEDVISEVRLYFELSGDGTYELLRKADSETLDKNRPLVSYGIEDDEELILTSGGQNV